MLLSALLVANMSACNLVSENDVEETTITFEYTDTESLNIENTIHTSEKRLPPSYSTQELIEELQLPSLFASVLKNETKICCARDNFLDYLNNFILGGVVEYADVSVLDLDNNGVTEVIVLECGDRVIILKEHEGTVYAWQFRHTALYGLRVDGTYGWSEQAGQVYGTEKLQFDGYKMNPIELDRVEYNEKFYINEVEVTEEAFLTYVQNQEVAEAATQYWWKTDFETPDYQINGK